jgi:DNA repair photolyase
MRPRAPSNPPSPYTTLQVAFDPEHEAIDEAPSPVHVTLLDDATRNIIAENDSPDVGFHYSVNPYRGCMHACAYCYARPRHEYLDLGAGTDFDTKIVVKRRAPQLLREAFEKRSWRGDLVVFSGVTDCYQPVERELGLTRGCLEVCHEYRNPVGIITKSAIIERDVALLAALARDAACRVHVSIPFADAATARAIEPWAPSPARRFRVLETLAAAGVPVGVMVAPVIPGCNDQDIAEILERAHAAGARTAGMVMLRLPRNVLPVFEERVRAALPLAAEKIFHRIREVRGGKLYDTRFFARQSGEGPYAQAVQQLFSTTMRRLGYQAHEPAERPGPNDAAEPTTFRRPERKGPQLSLF